MKWMFKLVFAAAALWSGYWFLGAQAQEKAFASLLQEGRNMGWTAESRSLGVEGFPNRFDTTMTATNFRDPSGRWGWRGDEFQIKALSYQPNHVIMAWPGTQVIDTPEGSFEVDSELLRASVVVNPNINLTLARFQLEGQDIALDSPQGWAATVETLNAALFQNELTPTRYRLGVNLKNIDAPRALVSALSGGAIMPNMVELVQLSAVLEFDAEIGRDALSSGTPPKPTSALIESGVISWGGSELSLDGELSAGANGYVDGFLTFNIREWQPMFEIFKQASHLSTTEKLTLKRALDGAANGGDLVFTLTFANGETSIGPFTIGRAPVYPF